MGLIGLRKESMLNLIESSLDTLFAWLSKKDKQSNCWPHVIKQKTDVAVCMVCNKKFPSLLKKNVNGKLK